MTHEKNRNLRDSYFLSDRNPLATVAQRDSEAKALRLLESPIVQQARGKVENWFRVALGRDTTPERESTFQNFIEEYVFHYAVIATNSDPEYPQVVQIYAPPHEWFGMRVPGSQFGNNPDNSYRIIPLDERGRYEVTVRKMNPGLDVTFTLMRGSAMTHAIATIEERDLITNVDGSLSITLDASSAAGRSNHIQIPPKVRNLYLYVRDSRSDWKQVPNVMTVRRLNPPTAEPSTDHELAERCAEMLTDDMAITYWFTRCVQAAVPNRLPAPHSPGPCGLFVQLQTLGSIVLNDDQALILTIDPKNAKYHGITVYDYWFVPRDIWHHTSSLNNAQSLQNADGTITYVVSIADPGVHNWLDTGGLHEVGIMYRNQGLPRDMLAAGRGPTMKCELVRLNELANALPKDVKTITPEERHRQMQHRQAELSTWFVD